MGALRCMSAVHMEWGQVQGKKVESEGEPQTASQLWQRAPPGLDSGLEGRAGKGILAAFGAIRGIAAGGRLIPCVWLELEDKIGWQRLSRQGPQCGIDNDWLGYLAVTSSFVFTCLQLHPLHLMSLIMCLPLPQASACHLKGWPNGHSTRAHLRCIGCRAPRCSRAVHMGWG